MKKMILIAGMFYAATSSAVVARVVATALSPVIVPGLCYIGQAQITYEGGEAPRKDYRAYMDGVYKGLQLPFSIAKDGVMPDIDSLPAHEQVGLFGSLSTYGTTLGLLTLLKKLK